MHLNHNFRNTAIFLIVWCFGPFFGGMAELNRFKRSFSRVRVKSSDSGQGLLRIVDKLVLRVRVGQRFDFKLNVPYASAFTVRFARTKISATEA